MAVREAGRAVLVVAQRTQGWSFSLIVGRPTFDAVAAAVAWSGVFWLVSAWAGWLTAAQGDGLLAILPATLLTAVTLSGAGEGFTSLLVLLTAAIPLIAVLHHDRREMEWRRSGVAFPAHKGRSLGLWALMCAAGLVAIAAALSSQTMKSLWENWTHPKVSRVAEGGGLSESLGIRSGHATMASSNDAKFPGLPRERLLTIGPDLAARPVMTVELTEPLSAIPAGLTVPFYWRSYTYDVYTGRGWQTSATEAYDVPASATVGDVETPYQQVIRLTLRSMGEGLTAVYGDGDIRRVDRPAVSEQRAPGDQFGSVVTSAESYQVESIVTVAPDNVLRLAGQRYPAPLADRFLQLPSNIPDRVRRLAVELTAGEATPYERARAIERYLRTLPYSLQVERPPIGQDVVDYFLFQAKGGYCDYYASAMVVLSRIAGIPARLAIGYASGERSEKANRFLVRESDAHSWAELYFPGIGWLTFEPTAARAPIDRSEVSEAAGASPPLPPPAAPAQANPVQMLGWLAGIATFALTASAGLWLVMDDQRLRQNRLAPVADDIYRQLRRYGHRLGVHLLDSMTPLEVGQAIQNRLEQLDVYDDGSATDLVMSAAQVATVVNGLVMSYYEPGEQQVDENVNSIPRVWVDLRWRLRRLWILWCWRRWLGSIQGAVQTSLSLHSRDLGPPAGEIK
ncbi:MAG: transglutaminase family protein [Anaerolineales bacterium]